MDEFKEALRAFIKHELVFDELIQVLERVLEQTPENSKKLLKLLTDLHKVQKLLDDENYLVLKSKIDLFDDITQFSPSEPVVKSPPLIESEPVIAVIEPESMTQSDYPTITTGITLSRYNTDRTHPPSEQRIESDEDILKTGAIIRENYRLEEMIGTGGMGVVWKAVDLVLEEGVSRNPYVAIKFLNTDFKEHPDALKAVVREFARYQRLRHPNIVEAYELSRYKNLVFIVMEFIKGISLKKFIQNHPYGMSLEEAAPIIKGMGDALLYAHQKGLVHLDFKPGNIFYDESEQISKVIDFGIARLIDPFEREKTRYDPGNLGALTESYASYEMLVSSDNDPPDPRDDIYALSCVTYQLLSGKHPFKKKKADTARHENLSPKPIESLKRKQWQALLHGLAFERQERTPTVEMFLEELFRKQFLWF